MFHVALFEPEIPPNTGNIIRLCVNTGTRLHLIHPLGFTLDDKNLQRAGLDYRSLANVREHESYQAFLDLYPNQRIFAISTKGKRCYTELAYQPGDIFLFGPETRGLPEQIRNGQGDDYALHIPMADNSRSLNLSNSVAVIIYEAWRQQGFKE